MALCYHSIAAQGSRASTARALFDEHLAWIGEHCDVVAFEDLPDRAIRANRHPDGHRPVVAITFDDGYEDNHREALPLLAAHGIPATFFIATGLVDEDEEAWASLRRAWGPREDALRPLSVEQLREMQAAGMAFGAHTRTHPNLRALDERDVRAEVANSRDRLEDLLQRPVRAFAYPFGDARFHLSATTVAVVASCGFLTAGTVEYRGVTADTDPLLVPRFPVGNDPIEILRAKVLGRLDLMGAWRERMPRWLTGAMSSGRHRGGGT